MKPAAFTLADADHAYEEWGANCGPGALAGVLGLTLDAVRPHLPGFDEKRYTNPAMMFAALRSLGVAYHRVDPFTTEGQARRHWPTLGLVRIQWEGPWTKPRVPIRARYRHTHWIGAAKAPLDDVGIFDINCINNGSGWVALADWEAIVVPHILATCVPRASGAWHQTHVLELGR
jgi:hypothetical protein